LDHRDLAEAENAAERFFMNVVLSRVLYAHALVAAPRIALGWLDRLAPPPGAPGLLDCARDGVLTYAWRFEDRDVWEAKRSVTIQLARRTVPPERRAHGVGGGAKRDGP
jgi:hypothetical protein